MKKWDLIQGQTARKWFVPLFFTNQPFLFGVVVLPVSAVTDRCVHEVINTNSQIRPDNSRIKAFSPCVKLY